MIRKTLLLLSLFLFFSLSCKAKEDQRFSTGGFYKMENSGREVYNMNPAWRFFKGHAEGAEQKAFDDSSWDVVSIPHGIETVPNEASGCVNYQGIVWYRKHFTPKENLTGKKVFLHFEGIMGKSKVFLNGKFLKEYYGGYLPVIIDVSEDLQWNSDNVIAVCADNSNDPIYPPGKPQEHLDFTYMGGIYRDCWLIAHNKQFITDANYEDITAGGGVVISFDKVSKKSAQVNLSAHLRNESNKKFKGSVEFAITSLEGKLISKKKQNIRLDDELVITDQFTIKSPKLWSPDTPHLHFLEVRILDSRGAVVDGYKQRFGIRSIDFKATGGFWLNGEPYYEPLIGGNRHQDYALVGNAVSNNAHWRDAKKMRDAGMKLVRNAHYPQDPAFMDACDELGLFVIINTPGWQFWNDEPIFEQRVYQDIRNMVRRDRNHASVWLWEPILNETWYPADFAGNTKKIVEEEFPYPNSFTACDQQAHGNEHFDFHFTHPKMVGEPGHSNERDEQNKTYYTREWGDNVDDWYSHNSTSRVARNWGEAPMLIQAQHYAKPEFRFTSIDALYRAWNESKEHVGGSLWHTFDHQRGYHPDPFYGGIMDAYRQPKLSYYMFQSQQKPGTPYGEKLVEPMVYIAHTMTPFSSKDVTIYSNCDVVELQFTEAGEIHTYTRDKDTKGIPYPVIVFDDVFDFMVDKKYARAGEHDGSFLLANGYIEGELVASHKVTPSRRPTQIILHLDDEERGLTADGSDFVTIIASIADSNGVVKRLNNYKIRFEVEGEGELINSLETQTNPMPVEWGTAPAMIRSTTTAGKIVVKAQVLWEGSQMPVNAQYTLYSTPPVLDLVYDVDEMEQKVLTKKSTIGLSPDKTNSQRADISTLSEVQKQQNEFGEAR